MTKQNLLYVFSTGPYSNSLGQEGLDALLMGAAFDQVASVLFIHDGVFQIKLGQKPGESEIKLYTKGFRALEDFGVRQVYVSQLALTARGLSTSDLSVAAEVLDQSEIVKLIASQHRVFTF